MALVLDAGALTAIERRDRNVIARLVAELSAAGAMVAIAAHTPELAVLSSRPILLGEPATNLRGG